MLNRVVIKICGEEFILRTEDPSEYVQKVGQYVNELMQNELKTSKVGLQKAAMLTAANIADELFKTKEADVQLRNQIKGYLEESSRQKAEISDLKREVLRLQKLQKKMEQESGKEKPRAARTRTTRVKKEPEAVREAEGPDEPTGISSKTPRVTGLLNALTAEPAPEPSAPALTVSEEEPAAFGATAEDTASEYALDAPKDTLAVVLEESAEDGGEL